MMFHWKLKGKIITKTTVPCCAHDTHTYIAVLKFTCQTGFRFSFVFLFSLALTFCFFFYVSLGHFRVACAYCVDSSSGQRIGREARSCVNVVLSGTSPVSGGNAWSARLTVWRELADVVAGTWSSLTAVTWSTRRAWRMSLRRPGRARLDVEDDRMTQHWSLRALIGQHHTHAHDTLPPINTLNILLVYSTWTYCGGAN